MQQGRFAGIMLVVLVSVLALGVAIIGLGLRIQRAELANGQLWRTDLENAAEVYDMLTEPTFPAEADEDEVGRLKTRRKLMLFVCSVPFNE